MKNEDNKEIDDEETDDGENDLDGKLQEEFKN